MPQLIVTARELKYAGKHLPKGSLFEASDKDAKVLKAIKRAEDAPDLTPVRKVASTKAPEAKVPEPVPESPAADPDPEPAPTAIEPLTTDDAPSPSFRRYKTRRLKAED